MYVGVALRAFRGYGFEVYLADLATWNRRLVTLVASHFGMSSQERKRRL